MGIAKPSPIEPPLLVVDPRLTIAAFIPIILPNESVSGPPELPKLIDASV
jgi:hypothetical protein